MRTLLAMQKKFKIIPADSGEKGATLLDSMVAIALMLVVFAGITAVFQYSLEVVTNNKTRAGAIALLNERMEYLRSLSYPQIGVVGGIPAGIVPQTETVTWNEVPYTRRTSVIYSDDPADGLGALDENDIIADYKTIRVDVSWTSRNGERSLELVGRVSPVGVETAVAGGVLTVSVVNEAAIPVSSAQIDIINTGTVPPISIRTYTNVAGIVSFIGAPAASNYQITVSKPGYSTAQTYPVSVSNPNPTPRHVTVVNDQTTSATFTIDLTATKTIETYMQYVVRTWDDSFADASLVSATTSADISGGEVVLAGGAPYVSPGSVRSVTLTPNLLVGWDSISFEDTTPAQTDILYRVYDTTDNLIPDAVLSGNSAGFSTSPIDISAIPHGTYTSLRFGAELLTDDPDVTPSLESWSVSYRSGPEALPNQSFSMRGSKTIGNSPTVYKYNTTHDSGAGASIVLSGIEADTYQLGIATTTGFNLAGSCNPQPEVLTPGGSQTTRLYLLPYTDNTLLVDVRSNTGSLLEGASVRLYKTGYDTTLTTSSCGQTFFNDLETATYSISVSKAGYQTYESSAVTVSNESQLSVVLPSL